MVSAAATVAITLEVDMRFLIVLPPSCECRRRTSSRPGDIAADDMPTIHASCDFFGVSQRTRTPFQRRETHAHASAAALANALSRRSFSATPGRWE
jgi:hypothetical protein